MVGLAHCWRSSRAWDRSWGALEWSGLGPPLLTFACLPLELSLAPVALSASVRQHHLLSGRGSSGSVKGLKGL